MKILERKQELMAAHNTAEQLIHIQGVLYRFFYKPFSF